MSYDNAGEHMKYWEKNDMNKKHSAVAIHHSITPSHQNSRWPSIVLIMAGVLFLWAPSLRAETVPTVPKEMTDIAITNAVDGALMLEKGVFPNDVDVSTSRGIVTLSGAGGHLLAKDRAVQIAKSIRGVRGVIDQITVTPVSRPDADIRQDIMTALLQDPATESYQVAVSVQAAVATLTGHVGSNIEIRLAERIAKGVKGIKEVHNNMTLKYREERTDAQIDGDVKSCLAWDIWINGDLINTAVKDGNVILSGFVGSAIVKSRAYDDAWVTGAKSVDASGLTVEPWAINDARRKNKNPDRADAEIKQAVQASLRLDPRVSTFSLDVSGGGGIVILSGVVGDLKAKASAEQDAKNIVGVWLVKNNLKVRTKALISDSEMTAQLTSALLWNTWLNNDMVHAIVSNRVAYLTGTVNSRFQKTEAQDVAARIKGVLSIHNQLQVEPVSRFHDYSYHPSHDYGYYSGYGSNGSPYYNTLPSYGNESAAITSNLSDEQIKKYIEDGFYWSTFVDTDDITVTVDGGVVTLSGTVGTWIGLREAEIDARNSGASSVLNRLVIE